MKKIALLMLVLASCKSPLPPPIESGKCTVLTYSGSQANTQRCVHDGIIWLCVQGTCVNVGNVPADPPKSVAPAPPAEKMP